MRCLNCGSELTGAYCPACGQAARTGRLGARDLLRPAADFINADRGWTRTAVELFRRPAAMIDGYLAGKRAGLTEPFKYTIGAIALALLALWLAAPPVMGAGERAAEAQRQLNELMQRYGNVMLLATVPLLALGTWLVFRARGLNFVEHLAINAYVFAQQNLVSLPFVLVGAWVPAWYNPAMVVYYAFCAGYFAWVLRGVAARAWWSALLGALVIMASSYLLFGIAVTAVLVLTRL
ncbi:MAG TPA: DUF3667 domain-containing protein [Opitutaceae bacterium]|nr:DUF3667 domain-containing protein [Opitutaceae bacterium]